MIMYMQARNRFSWQRARSICEMYPALPLTLVTIVFWDERALGVQVSVDDSESKSLFSQMKDSLQCKMTKKTGQGKVFQAFLPSCQSARGAQCPSQTDLTREPFCYGTSYRAGVPWSILWERMQRQLLIVSASGTKDRAPPTEALDGPGQVIVPLQVPDFEGCY